jgi:hypothetical protein
MAYKDPNKAKEYKKKWKKANKKLVKAEKERYYQAHKEERKAYSKSYRQANKDLIKAYNAGYKQANKDMTKAHRKARSIPMKGVCESCGKQGVTEKHHPDYSKPLEVVHLCISCHKRLHAEIRSRQETKENSPLSASGS